jgi:archaetidylinositol phosphate synthase
MPDIKSHKRVHDMLLGPLERPALQWLCAHMPAWANSDFMTVVGIIGSLVTFFSYWLTNIDKNFLWFASLGFVINWFGDSLDGTIARYRKEERPKFGFFIDHTIDAISQVFVFTGLGLSPYVRLEFALLALIGYLLMSILAYVGAFVSGEFKISYARIGPTEMRLIAILANTSFYFVGNPVIKTAYQPVSVFDLVVLIIAVVLMVAFIVTTTGQAVHWREVDARERD